MAKRISGTVIGALTAAGVAVGGAMAWAAKKRNVGTSIGPVSAAMKGASGTQWLSEFIGSGDGKGTYRFRVYWMPPTGATSSVPVVEYLQQKASQPGYATSIDELRGDTANRWLTKLFDPTNKGLNDAAIADFHLKTAG